MNTITRSSSRTVLLWTSLFIASTAAAFAAEVVIPGTSVSLDAPEGFTLADGFSGLQRLEDGSSITIIEFPGEAYGELSALFASFDAASKGLAEQGVLLESIETYSAGDRRVPVLIGSQPFGGTSVGKYTALFRGDKTVMVTFNVFDQEALTPGVVKAAIESVRLSSAPTVKQKVEQLPFAFQSKPPFRVGDTLGGSGVFLSTFEGTDPTGMKPAVIVVRALREGLSTADTEHLGRELLRGTVGFEDAEITKTEKREFGGGVGHYLEAVAGNRKVVQYVRMPPDGAYVRLVAFGETAELERVLPAVSEIAQSVSIRTHLSESGN